MKYALKMWTTSPRSPTAADVSPLVLFAMHDMHLDSKEGAMEVLVEGAFSSVE